MPQDSYELPSVYISLEKQQEMASAPATSCNRPTETTTHFPPRDHDTRQLLVDRGAGQEETDCSIEEEMNARQHRQSVDSGSLEVYHGQMEQDWWLACLMLSTSFSMLFFTVIPVVANLPDIVPSWFSGDTLWRLFDPLFTLPLNLFIMTRSNVITSGGKPNYCEFLVLNCTITDNFILWGIMLCVGGNISEQSVTWLFWALGAGIFVQGHGLHTAAAMFKHPVQDFNVAHPDAVAEYPVLYQIYSNMRDLWEHIVAHYMYAFGGMIMSWAQLFAFRHQVHGPLTFGTKVVFMFGSLIYGLLLAGIAIEFPDGLYGKSKESNYKEL
ncbi:hypothetical protein [Absidia glauca]|uniref:Uncharacterized protein n=1 Tax=Absidia glauca TaxID=4829 RepID=A0A163KMZ8_ABSGL|nr:hypothetical protein [Absidia glauca]